MSLPEDLTPSPSAPAAADSRPSLRAEILAVGTELLMGETVNSNATWLSAQLADIGVDVFHHITVGDNPARIRDAFRAAFSRANLILVTGGLGPTDDDLTLATLAGLLDAPMIPDPLSEDRIRQFFITRDMPMSSKNLKQALRPEGAELLFNRVGTAPGVFWDLSDIVQARGWGLAPDPGPTLVMAFPGVPSEMKTMWTSEALPRLQPFLPRREVLVKRFLKFFGIGESMLGDRLSDLMESASPTVSPYVGNAEVKIRLAVKAETREAGLAELAPLEAEIRSRVGAYCYGADDDTLEAAVGETLKATGRTLGIAESCTGGLVSCRLTDVMGASAFTWLNVVTYSNEAKTAELGVPKALIEAHGAVSEPVAAAMAEGIRRKAGTTIGMSLTGLAGPPSETDTKPVGLVYIGLSGLTEAPIVKTVRVNPEYTREQVKFWFSQYALSFARLYSLGLLDPDESATVAVSGGRTGVDRAGTAT